MIEKLIKKEITLKRWRRFKKRKTAFYSSLMMIIMVIMTIIAPMLANSKPLYLNFNGESFFPVFKVYSPSDFGKSEGLFVDYKKLELKENDFSIWPFIRWDPFESNNDVDSYPSKPTSDNYFGTDESGRDVLTRLLYGFFYSIAYAFLVWLFSFIIGTIFGGVMGFFGGWFDILMQRVVEVFSTVPQLFLLLILVSIFDPNLLWLVLITTIFGWINISYYVRAEFLRNRKREYVEAARGLGASNFKIIFKHILPNSLTPVITFAPFVISGNIVGLASLDYLGFGLPVPTPSWGEMLAQAQNHFTTAWWLAIYPFFAFFITLTLLNLIGEGVRDAMDPNMN